MQLNNAYQFICAKIAKINEDFFEEQKVKFDLGLNSSLFSLPTDFLKFKQLRLAYTAPTSESDYKVASPYDPTTVEDINSQEENISTSNPIVDITNNYYRIKPVATSLITNGGELYYIARPSALTLTGDSPVFPADYHDLLSLYASQELCVSSDKFDKYKVYKSEYEKQVDEMLKELTPRHLDNPERIRNILETGRGKTITELW